MGTTAPIATTRPTHQATVRMRPLLLPKAPSAFDGKTVRLRPLDLPVVATVANTMRQRYADLSTLPSRPTKWVIGRVALILVLAGMPILGIVADVFGVIPQSVTSVVVIALLAVMGAVVAFAPHRIDLIVGRGFIAGMVACIVYDAARLFAVHVLGLMGDFIAVMGSWVTGEPDTTGSAAVGYVWRYVGDGGGLGVAFFVFAFALGIDRWKNVHAVASCVAFAVFPTWAGLIATVALAPRGEQMMFPLTPATVAVTLIGHLIFGLVLGLAFVKAPRGQDGSEWPWPPLLASAPVKRIDRFFRRITHRP